MLEKSTIAKRVTEEESERYELARAVITGKHRSENGYYTFVRERNFKICKRKRIPKKLICNGVVKNSTGYQSTKLSVL